MRMEDFSDSYLALRVSFSNDRKTFYAKSNPISSYDTSMIDISGSTFDELNRFIEFDFSFISEYKKELKPIYEKIFYTNIDNSKALNLFNDYMALCKDIAEETKNELPLLAFSLNKFIDDNQEINDYISFDFIAPMEALWDEIDGILLLQRDTYILFEEVSQLQLQSEDRTHLPMINSLSNINMKIDLSYDEGELKQTYLINSAEMLYSLLVTYYFASYPNISLCQNCNRFFEPKTKKVTLYCDRVTDSGRTCKKEGALSKHKNNVDGDEVIKKFNAERHRIYMYCQRSKVTEYDFFYDYYNWLDEAEPLIAKYKSGNLSADDVLNKLEEMQKEFQSYSKSTNTRNRAGL